MLMGETNLVCTGVPINTCTSYAPVQCAPIFNVTALAVTIVLNMFSTYQVYAMWPSILMD